MTTPEVIVTASAFDFQRDLGRYWRHARRMGEITLTQQGWVYKASFRTMLAALNQSDAPADEQHNGRLWFMRRLLVAMRELSGSNLDHTLRINPNGKLLGLPMAQRIRWTFDMWRDSGAWNELGRLPSAASGIDPRRDAPLALGKARHTVLRAMSRLANANSAPAEWQDPLDLIGHLKRNEYQFLFERRHRSTYGGLYTSPYYGPNNPYGLTFTDVKDEASGWKLIEHGFIVNALTGPLHWMGLVELGYTQTDPTPSPSPKGEGQRGGVGENAPPTAYRLTEVGAWLLGIGPEPAFVESGGKVIVQPNFTILALEPISDTVLNDLDHFAEVQGGERAIAYQLTRESLYQGQQSGWDAARVMQFLEAHQGAPVPTNIRRTLEEWESAHRRITFHRNACVVQFADDAAQDESAPALAPFQPHALGGRFELIAGRDASEVLSALREAGWVPTLHPANHSDSEGVLRASDDGQITFTQPAPSIYALGKLAAFALTPNPSPSGRGEKITPDSIRVAMSAGMPLDQLLATLAELHTGPIPEALEHKIRAWASFYGSATLQSVVLLELSSLDVLTNLLNDPEVGPHLTPVEGAVTPTAIVDSTRVDDVRRMLTERGIAV
jgi:hypothetical protein